MLGCIFNLRLGLPLHNEELLERLSMHTLYMS